MARARQAWLAAGEKAGGLAERVRREKTGFLCYEVSGPDGPLYWDFHALRHYYITGLANQADISPATLLSLARHADPRLTLGTYTHARDSADRAAADRLPKLEG